MTRFPYLPYQSGQALMPQLQATVFSSHGLRRLTMLVDSGAYLSVLPDHLGEALRLPVLAEGIELETVGGVLSGRMARASFRLPVVGAFSSHVVLADVQDAILGHRDFFETFWVAFDNRAQRLLVRPH